MKMLIFAAAILAGSLMAGTAAAQEFGPTLLKIKDSGVITIGHRETSIPFSYVGSDGKVQGFSIDLCMRIVDSVEAKIGVDELQVRFVPVTPQTRIPLVANGTVNIECGSTTNNLTREEQVDYSFIHYITGTKLLVKKDSGIQNIDDLNGKVIGLAQGTTNERHIKEAIAARNLNTEVLNVKDHAEGFLALETGRVDAYSTDDILLFGLIAKAKSPEDYAVVGDFLSYDPYSLMLPQNDSEFRLVVNATLARIYRSGEINEIFKKWFDPMGVEMSDLLAANFRIHGLPD